MRFRRVSAGFILPTVVIASVVLFAVLTVAVSTMSGTASSLDSRAYQNVASEAAESGLKYADSCIDVNGIATITWSGGIALYPSVACTGATSCSLPECYLSSDDKTRTSFKVTAEMSLSSLVVDITSVGTVELLRTDGSVWKSYTRSAKVSRGVGTAFDIMSITTGDYHTCVLGSNGGAYCWGANSLGQLGNGTTADSSIPVAVNTIPGGVTFLKIVAGDSHTCAIGSDAKAYCWGYNDRNRLGDGTTTNRSAPTAVIGIPVGVALSEIAAGSNHTCAASSDGKAYCWGWNAQGQLGDGTTTNRSTATAVSTISGGVTLSKIYAGSLSTCALGSNSKVYCWGWNGLGQLGDGTTTDRSIPTAVSAISGGVTLSGVALGSESACAIGSNGKAYCWGGNSRSQLGDGTTTDRSAPTAVNGIPGGVVVSKIATGNYHTCALGSDAKTYCWGSNGAGQLGDGTFADRSAPTAVVSIPVGVTLTDIDGGHSHTCAVGSNNKAYCWGDNFYGQLGDNKVIDVNIPTAVNAVPGGVTLSGVGAGYSHTCALGSDSKAYCWGYNGYGQLGNGTTTNSSVPTAVSAIPGGVTLLKLAVGESYACALGSDGKVYCWGYNGDGELGNGTTTNSSVPTAVNAVPGGVTLSGIAAGSYHACALGSDGKVYCWGYNSDGQLGNGTTNDSSVPIAVSTVPGGVTLSGIVANSYHTCALGSNAKAYCWGYNGDGQLGNGTTTDSSIPVAVSSIPGGVTPLKLAAGESHTCALGSDAKVYCWGYNNDGELGDGTTTDSSLPTAVSAIPGGVTLSGVTAGSYHTCALGSDAKVYCWGYNGDGQLGNGTTTSHSVPTAVNDIPGGVTLSSVIAGSYHTCALGSDTKVYCWGENDDGQLGDYRLKRVLNGAMPESGSSFTIHY